MLLLVAGARRAGLGPDSRRDWLETSEPWASEGREETEGDGRSRRGAKQCGRRWPREGVGEERAREDGLDGDGNRAGRMRVRFQLRCRETGLSFIAGNRCCFVAVRTGEGRGRDSAT